MPKKSIAIVGAGISGLRVAYLLVSQAQGEIGSLILFEKDGQIGGCLQRTKENGYLFEHGAQGVLFSRAAFVQCARDVGLEDSLCAAKPGARRRFFLTPNRLVRVSLFSLLRARVLRFVDIFRIFSEIFVRPASTLVASHETIFAFFCRRFGRVVATRLLIPLAFGIWGGGARVLLLRYAFPKLRALEKKHGSLLRAIFLMLVARIWKTFRAKQTSGQKLGSGLATFTEGMPALPEALFLEIEKLCAQKKIDFSVRLRTQVGGFVKQDRGVGLLCSAAEGSSTLMVFDCVVHAAQPWQPPQFSVSEPSGVASGALAVLRGIPTHSLAVVGLGGKMTPRLAKLTQGFGALAGEWSTDLLGVIFVHSSYPCHVPPDCFLYRVMLGGEADPFLCQESEQDILRLAKDRLRTFGLVEPTTSFEFEKVVKWENFIPLATEHQDLVAKAVWQLEALLPGLFLTGNYLMGVSVSDCLEQAAKTAHRVFAFIRAS